MFYRALDQARLPVEDFVDAASVSQALTLLHARGFSQVELMDEPSLATLRDADAPALSATAARDVARLAAVTQRPGNGLWTIWRQVLRNARWWLAFALLLAGYGVFAGNGFLAILGVVMLGLPFLLSGLSYRHMARYEAFLRAAAFGKREEMRRLAQLLGRAMADPSMGFDLKMREAEFVAREQGIEAALAQVEPLRASIEQRARGLFPARAALLYLAADDAPGFVRGMREAWEASGHDASRALDAALAQARCGDPAAARELLADIDVAALPLLAESFHAWVQALLAEHAGEDGREAYSRALAGFTEHVRLSAIWAALATCTCDYALALARHGELAHGHALAQAVWPVARIHLDAATKKNIQHTFFAGRMPAAPEH